MRALGLAAGALAAVVLAACGGDGGDDAEGGNGDDGATQAFCDDYAALEEELADVDFDDPAAFSGAIERISELDPPDEIADEFDAVIELNREISSAGQDAGVSDPEAAAQVQEQFSERAAELEEESQRVDEFLTEECGIGGS